MTGDQAFRLCMAVVSLTAFVAVCWLVTKEW